MCASECVQHRSQQPADERAIKSDSVERCSSYDSFSFNLRANQIKRSYLKNKQRHSQKLVQPIWIFVIFSFKLKEANNSISECTEVHFIES